MPRLSHLLVDIENLSIEANVKGPPRGERLILVDNAVCGRDLFGGVAQHGIVQAERLRERLVRLRLIYADREVRHIELPNRIAALTERLAFRGSSSGESLGKPSEHHHLLALVIGQPIGLPVGTWQ
jgi:hypothetical protein